MSPRRLLHIQPALLRAFPALQSSLRFDLPHESTSDYSPIQRLVYHKPYFSHTSDNPLEAFAQAFDRIAQRTQEPEGKDS
jgi:hypothetical protein